MRLQRGRVALELDPHGAALASLTFDGVELLLPPDGLGPAARDALYLNCIVGRVSNRIAGGRFTRDGVEHRLSTNEGSNTLHGGVVGWGARPWTLEAGDDGIVAAYRSPDGEMGFPGTVDARVAFQLGDDALHLRFTAVADRPTPLALTSHLYFNLSGRGGTVLDHTLQVAADAYTPVRPDLIPTGEIAPVAGTPFDLRTPRRLGAVLAGGGDQLARAGGLDHNLVLRPGARPALRLTAPESGISLAVETDQPGLQLYSGQGLTPPHLAHGALVIEPQDFPDAVNQPGFPSCILRPGDTYDRRMTYRLSRA